MKKKLLTLFAVLSFVLVLAACGGSNDSNDSSSNDEGSSSGESVTLLANAVYPEANHTTGALIEFAEKVNEATDGQVTIDVMAGGALGFEGPELLSAVRDNAVPISDILTSGVAGDEPLFELVTLPFLVQNFEEAETLKNIARPYFEKVAEENWNQKILYIIPWPFAGFWTQDPVQSAEDMKGLKMRTYDTNGALVVEAGGGTPHPLPFSEVYSGLSTGIIDSVLTSSPTAVDASFWEVLDYYSPVNVTMATSFASINLDEFNKLDAAAQEAIIQAGKEIEEKLWQEVPVLDENQVKIATDNGIEKIEVSEAFMQELTKMTEDIRNDWLENSAPEEAKEIVNKFYEEVGR